MFFIQLLGLDPLAYFVALVTLAFALVLHNIAQASIAAAMGDSTAKLRGFTSTEPRLHFNTFSLIWLAVFGLALPTTIPLNSYVFSKRASSEAFVWWSGPLVMVVWSFLLFTASLLTARFGGEALLSLAKGFDYGASNVLSLGVIFLFPVPPLDGARAVFAVGSPEIRRGIASLEQWMSRTPFSFMIIFVVLSVLGVTGAISGFFLNDIFTPILQAVGL
jgi:Zn-dependent protease